MELRVLNYFLMVAREGNITKAAELLHVTQPTLSRQLSQLEVELGVKLFQRGQHGITLTEDGLLLRRRAQEIVALAAKTERELSHADDLLAGEITIGSGETKN
ncbi:MAG: LysR family transcriptional regulator, partial [Caldilineaceae bacterium]|nr:LysR family transcriptional regulator [Caldilineaceae bacterium]